MTFDWQNPVIAWAWADTHDEQMQVVRSVTELGLSAGDFTKTILRLAAAAKEVASAAYEIKDVPLCSKAMSLYDKLVKGIVIPVSLYI